MNVLALNCGSSSMKFRLLAAGGFDWCGMTLDDDRNASTLGEGVISADHARS
jgi:acetate kinase